jgi:hypothetical protein
VPIELSQLKIGVFLNYIWHYSSLLHPTVSDFAQNKLYDMQSCHS